MFVMQYIERNVAFLPIARKLQVIELIKLCHSGIKCEIARVSI